MLTLCEFLANQGGLRTVAASGLPAVGASDLRAIDARAWHRAKPFRRRLVRDDGKGVSPDHATLIAWEAGYFPAHAERPEIDALIDAIRQELNGKPILTVEDEERAAIQEQARLVAREDDYAEFSEPLPEVSHHVPDGSVPVYDVVSGAIAYLYGKSYTTKSGRQGMTLYAKIYRHFRDAKAASHHVYKDEAERDAAVAEFFGAAR